MFLLIDEGNEHGHALAVLDVLLSVLSDQMLFFVTIGIIINICMYYTIIGNIIQGVEENLRDAIGEELPRDVAASSEWDRIEN